MDTPLLRIKESELENIHGGFPWAFLSSALTLIHREAPDFLAGWRDFDKGKFLPPISDPGNNQATPSRPPGRRRSPPAR